MKKTPLILLSLGIVFAAAFGSTAASWAVSDNADSFGLKVSIDAPATQHSVTFYKAFANGEWANPETIVVNDGETLTAPVVSVTGYTTLGWNETKPCLSCYTPYDDFTVDNINKLPITRDMVLYPNVESNNNRVYIHDLGYIGDADTDITLTVNSIGQTLIGKQYLGVTGGMCNPIASWNNARSLHTSNGIYKFVNDGGAAKIYRKIGFKPNGNWTQDWSGSPAFFIHAWNDSGVESDICLGNISSGGKAYGYIRGECSGFMVIRNEHGKTSIDWDHCNKSGDMTISDTFEQSTKYSNTKTCLSQYDNSGWDSWGKNNSYWIA